MEQGFSEQRGGEAWAAKGQLHGSMWGTHRGQAAGAPSRCLWDSEATAPRQVCVVVFYWNVTVKVGSVILLGLRTGRGQTLGTELAAIPWSRGSEPSLELTTDGGYLLPTQGGRLKDK